MQSGPTPKILCNISNVSAVRKRQGRNKVAVAADKHVVPDDGSVLAHAVKIDAAFISLMMEAPSSMEP